MVFPYFRRKEKSPVQRTNDGQNWPLPFLKK